VPPQAADPNKPQAKNENASPGGLRVYQNGVEVFHLNGGDEKSAGKAAVTETQPPIAPENQTVELAPAALQDNLLYRLEPEYPEEAREKHIESVVVLKIHISRDGTVKDEKMLSGNPLLGQAAIDAVRQWRFKPQRIDGHLVEAETVITLFFRLQG
jgi:protein TonB